MTDKIFLGRLKTDAGTHADGENIYITKHQWDCGWYWGFGYLGNKNCHFHFESLVSGVEAKRASKIFDTPQYTDDQWWIIRDLFVQAYALKAAAEVYRYGGHQVNREGVTDILRNAEKAAMLNIDLKIVLDTVWNYLLVNQKSLG